jgi:nitrate/nitrite-specific signal transduction histidine kinase
VQGARRVPWRPSLDEPGPVSTAWAKRTAIVDRRPADLGGRRTGSALLILPLTADQRAVGLLILESSDTEAFDAAAIRAVTREAVEATPAIETAALFDELRILAATEERSRLAREMHDGIAQDLAYLGYQVDAVTRAIQLDRKDDAEKLSQELRHEMSRLTQDLRLSITDLKSSIGPARSVTAALTEYARSAGTGAGITVHLSLTEETVRLPADTEVGLLRIAHEAITAARRRPNTRNLWVTLVSDPPSFALEVADDGESGSGKTGTSARSTEIMDEIAGRIGGVLRTTRRPGGGISVHVQTRGDGS